MANSAWGIDLGNRALKAVKLVREGSQLRIDDFEVIEHEQTLSVAGDNKESLLQTALANFVQRHDAKGSVVGVSVSGQQSFARFIKLPPVEPKKIPEIVRFEAIQQIPFPLDDVEWSYQLFQDQDSPDVEVGIFAMKKDLVNQQIEYFTKLGLDVQAVQMHPLAVYNAMYFDDRVDQTVMFMDSGAENTDLIIADKQTVWLRTLPIGGNNFTETLAKSFKLSFQKAEELKRNAATSKYAKQIFQAMRPVFADLVAEIQRSIGFYASVHRDARIGKIVAQGSTFQLPGLQKYLQQNLQMPVEKLDSFKAMPAENSKTAADLSENVISLAGAYGLALQALGEAQIKSSLLPESIRRTKMWREKTKWFAAAAALVVAGTMGVAGSYAYNSASYDHNSSIRDDNKRTLTEANKLINNWKQGVETGGEEDRNRLLTIRSLYENRDLLTTIIADVLGSVPPDEPDLQKLKAIPRAQRRQILLTDIRSDYKADMGSLLSADLTKYSAKAGTTGALALSVTGNDGSNETDEAARAMGRGGRGAPAAQPAVAGGRGFVLTIKGITPNKGQQAYINQEFIQKLLARTAEAQVKEHKQYYVHRVELAGSRPRVPAEGTDRRFRAGLAGGADPEASPDLFRAGGRGNAAGGGALDNTGLRTKVLPPLNPLADRFFPDETIDKDLEFTVLALIVVDPEAALKPASRE